MNKSTSFKDKFSWLLIVAAVLLAVSFFLPWVSWGDGIPVSGSAMPAGKFFSISGSKFGLQNPFPQYSFSLSAFWAIPALAAIVIIFHIVGKKTAPYSFIAGALSLSLIVVYILFSSTLIDLGVGKNALHMLLPSIFVQAISAIALIASTASKRSWPTTFFWIIIGPLLAYASYTFIKKHIETETFSNTSSQKALFAVNAINLIREFVNNDTVANKKYTGKILTVNGMVSELEPVDTTMNIKFIDSTSGSYAIFALQQEDITEAKKLNVGDSVSVKGECSGGVFSRLRKTTFITFKRSTINKLLNKN